MISADEARQKTRANITNGTTRELLEITTQIEEAIEDGEFEICSARCLKDETHARLGRLGYKIELVSQYNELYYRVSWYEI